MAAFPPPYSPRDARRQARDAARFQRAQYRAQTSLLRQRPSFVGPMLLIGAGVVALLLETGYLNPSTFWPFYARYWPVLLILVGFGLLVEYFFDRRNPQLWRRRRLGGIIPLIVVLSFAGYGSHVAFHMSPWGRQFSDAFGDGDWLAMMGPEHDSDVTLQHAVSPSGTLTIDNPRGEVQVSAEEGSEISVQAHQVVHNNSDSAARRDLDETRPALDVHGSDANLTVPGKNGASVDLKVTVPPGTALVLHTTHGDVALSGLRRDVNVKAAHADVTVDNMGAAVHLQMDHGDVIVRDVAGDLTIDGRADDISISGVKGRSLLNGDFFGDTQLQGTGAPVHFHSSLTDLEVPKLGGELTLDKDDLRLVNPSGGIRLTARSKNIEVTDLVGDAHIDDSNDDVNVTAAMPLGNLELSDHTGAIVVTVPANAQFSVHATADESDEVTNDFGLPVASSSGRKTLTGQVGSGGPHLELDTNHGDLTLRRGGAEAPERLEAPENPERPERHLHAKGAEPKPTVQ